MDRGLISIPGLLLSLLLAWFLVEIIRSLRTRHLILQGTYRNPAQCERALDHFSRRLARHPNDWETYMKRGEAFAFLKNYQQTLRDYSQALVLHPHDETILVRRARVHYCLRTYDEAIWDCTRAIEINPHYSPAYSVRGLAYFASEEYERATRDYTRAIEINPDHPQNYINRGHYYLRMMELEKARADWQKSWSLKPDIATGLMLNWLKLALNDEQDDEVVACELERAAALAPRSADAYLCQSIALYLRKAPEEALSRLSRALSMRPGTALIYFWQGMILAALQRNMQADQAFLRTNDLGLPKALWQPMLRLGPQALAIYSNYGGGY